MVVLYILISIVMCLSQHYQYLSGQAKAAVGYFDHADARGMAVRGLVWNQEEITLPIERVFLYICKKGRDEHSEKGQREIRTLYPLEEKPYP
jgi:hypothetical protein